MSFGGNNDEWDCAVAIGSPYVSGSSAKARGDIACAGSQVDETKLSVSLSRFNNYWQNLDAYNSGWVSWNSHGHTVSGNCASGTYTYKNVVKGWVKLDNGEIYSDSDNNTASLSC